MCFYVNKTKLPFSSFSSIHKFIVCRRVLATMEIKDASFTNALNEGLDTYLTWYLDQLINCLVGMVLALYIKSKFNVWSVFGIADFVIRSRLFHSKLSWKECKNAQSWPWTVNDWGTHETFTAKGNVLALNPTSINFVYSNVFEYLDNRKMFLNRVR